MIPLPPDPQRHDRILRLLSVRRGQAKRPDHDAMLALIRQEGALAAWAYVREFMSLAIEGIDLTGWGVNHTPGALLFAQLDPDAGGRVYSDRPRILALNVEDESETRARWERTLAESRSDAPVTLVLEPWRAAPVVEPEWAAR